MIVSHIPFVNKAEFEVFSILVVLNRVIMYLSGIDIGCFPWQRELKSIIWLDYFIDYFIGYF